MTRQSVKWSIFAVTTLGNFSSMLDFSSVNIALYQISNSFALPVSTVQWVMLSYQIVLTSLLIFFGRLGDLTNRKKLYTAGFLLFGAGAAGAYFAQAFPVLLAARTVQGVGGSILIANSFSIVSLIFKGKQRGKALGFMGAVTHLAGMSAPVVSGFIIEHFAWRCIFLPGVFIASAAVFLSWRFVPASFHHQKADVDTVGTFLLAASVSLLLYMLAEGASWQIAAALIVSAGLFLYREKTVAAPLVDFRLFKNKAFLFGCLALMTSYWAMYPNTVLFPFYSQGVLENSAQLTGELILPFSLFYLITSINTGTLPPYKRMVCGICLMGIALALFAQTTLTTSNIILILMQILIGVSNALFQPSANAAILGCAPKQNIGMASGIMSLFRNTGIATGSVFSVMMFEHYKADLLAQGADMKNAFLGAYHVSLYIGALFAVLCLFWLIIAVRAKRGEEC